MGGFEKVALKKAADYAALEFRKTILESGGALCFQALVASDGRTHPEAEY